MKLQLIGGILLAVFGGIILIRGLEYGSQSSVIRVGDYQASVQSRRSAPMWVGGVAVVGGVLLIGASLRRNPRGA